MFTVIHFDGAMTELVEGFAFDLVAPVSNPDLNEKFCENPIIIIKACSFA